MSKVIYCPECKNEMLLVEVWLSQLAMGRWYKYCCEYCSGIFEVKRGMIIKGEIRTARRGGNQNEKFA